MQSFFLVQLQFLAPEGIFQAVERFRFVTRVDFFFTVLRAWFVTSTLCFLEGERLGTAHIMEGTCSRLRFFVRDMNTDMNIYTSIHIHIQIHVFTIVRVQFSCACTCVSLSVFALWCRVMSCAARRWLVWCGVVWCVVLCCVVLCCVVLCCCRHVVVVVVLVLGPSCFV